MVKFDSITVGVVVGTLCFLVVALVALVAWLFRKIHSMTQAQIDRVELLALKAEVKTSTNQANIQANKDLFLYALKVARLEGEVKSYNGLLRGFSSDLIRQSKDHALGQVRHEMHKAIHIELLQQQKAEAQFKSNMVGKPSTYPIDPNLLDAPSDEPKVTPDGAHTPRVDGDPHG